MRVYRQESDRQKLLVKKSQLTENRLLFIVSALKKLFHDENFVTLLRAEGLDQLPAYLGERIKISEKALTARGESVRESDFGERSSCAGSEAS